MGCAGEQREKDPGRSPALVARPGRGRRQVRRRCRPARTHRRPGGLRSGV